MNTMKNLTISRQIIFFAILPALAIAIILSAYFMLAQFRYISDSLDKQGIFIAKQLSPAAEYVIYSGNNELIKPLINGIIKNNSIIQRIQILDRGNNSILDIERPDQQENTSSSFFTELLESRQQLSFDEAVVLQQILVDDHADRPVITDSADSDSEEDIGRVRVTLTTRYAAAEKLNHIINGTLITSIILLAAIFIIIRKSRTISGPIKSLTDTVRDIASGNLDVDIEKNAIGEIGVLQSCIIHMSEELKNAQADMENQLDVYTHELQQTMEELEIRNAELDITRSKAIYANNAKSEFLANMSHELRTPLSGIIGFTELLQGTPLSSQQTDYASTIRKSAKNLLEIINDILDLAKIESGKTEITTSEFDLVDLIEDITNLLSPSALEKEIELFYRIDNDVPTTIQSDPYRIHQILTNLIGNAIKFTDSGHVYLQVTAGETDNNDNCVRFTISDTGIGMSDDDKKKLFKAFSQADTSIARRFGGTGLGLVISRKLTLLMKGEIGFDSTPGEGSTFWFRIPVTPVALAHQASELSGRRIACICNHAIARQSFKTFFNSLQCKVTDYTTESLHEPGSIEKHCDLIVVFLSRKDINDDHIMAIINNASFTRPSLLIASTRSHSELRNLQKQIFDNAVFTSEKTRHIEQKMVLAINKSAAETEADNQHESGARVFDWSNIKVMVVDDNEINLRLAEIILRNHKACVTTARSGKQAVDNALLDAFDIIFMDLHMPGIDGYEATKKIREITTEKQPVIIALTANALPLEREKVIESGMNGILIKPVNDIILQKVISQWLMKEPVTEFDSKTVADDSDNRCKETVFSLELARGFTGNNEQLAYELFGMLQAELDSYRSAITAAANNRDLAALREQAHKLHGASRCCGTTELKNASSHLERLIDRGTDFDITQESSTLLDAINNVARYRTDRDKAGGHNM